MMLQVGAGIQVDETGRAELVLVQRSISLLLSERPPLRASTSLKTVLPVHLRLLRPDDHLGARSLVMAKGIKNA